jgi:hypothetical protein
VKRAAEGAVSKERQRQGLEPPILQSAMQRVRCEASTTTRRSSSISTLILAPGAAHAELRHKAVHRIRSRRNQHIPALYDRRQPVDIDEVGVYQHFARCQRHKGGVDVHGATALAFEFMEAQSSVAEVTPQPADPGLVRHIAAGDEQVATAACDALEKPPRAALE